MKKRQKANKSRQKIGPDMNSQPPAELTDEQLQQVVGGGGLPSSSIPPAVPVVGDEVLVSFEQGSPDRPYIIGNIVTRTWNG